MSGFASQRDFERRCVCLRFNNGLRPIDRAALLGWYAATSGRVPSKLPLFDDAVATGDNDIRLSFPSIEAASIFIRRVCRISFASLRISSLKYVKRESLATSLSADNQFVVSYETKGGLKVTEEKELVLGLAPKRGYGRGGSAMVESSPPPVADSRFASIAKAHGDVSDEETQEKTPIYKSEDEGREDEKEKEEKKKEKEKNKVDKRQSIVEKRSSPDEKLEMEPPIKVAKDSMKSAAAIDLVSKRQVKVLDEIKDIAGGKFKMDKKCDKTKEMAKRREEAKRLGRIIQWIVKEEYEVSKEEASFYLGSNWEPPLE